MAQRRPGGTGSRRAHAPQTDPRPRPQADRQGADAGQHAARRRARRAVHGARAVILPARRAAHQAAVSRYEGGRARLLQEDRHVPDHASGRHQERSGREISLAALERLQGVLRGQGARHDRPARRQRADGDPALAHPGDRGHHGGHGQGFLGLRHPRKHEGDHRADAVSPRAGVDRPQGRGRGAVPPVDVRDFQGLAHAPALGLAPGADACFSIRPCANPNPRVHADLIQSVYTLALLHGLALKHTATPVGLAFARCRLQGCRLQARGLQACRRPAAAYRAMQWSEQ